MSSLLIPNISTLVSVKVSETNYLLWESQIKPFLVGQDYWKFLDGSYPCPSSFLTTTVTPSTDTPSESSPTITTTPNPQYTQL
ncbi:hypothetical protein L3X38_005150 [Prunus dulcis]|uniref:Retrotransposon Copia-like N-terminal domain-containing protein n=1 Tax=Prunus dulcis TaxID=3755 RepID=A0AAD4ZQE9_PRUDU|nr:hypothetical protein L3X38_005150 [Prunus dulcis]